MRSGARAGFRSRLSPDWSGAAGRGREGPPALTLPDAEALRGGAVWGPGPGSPDPLPRRPHSCPRAHPLGSSAGSPACARHGRPPLGPAPGSRRGLAAQRLEPWEATASPGWGTRRRPAQTPGRRGRRGGERRGGRRDFRHGTRKGPRRRWWEL